ncbi:uncharacterized protein LOC126410546 [Nymphaea colorata]|uniref:uncharacterized protein LOC126410546 n=1 Tax=Nymphaea colorata TaxID=210225 RepID=UPI00214F2F16|nr:uncharacterized protein LOC126410546 [Nymphaea colorata]
MVNKKMVRSSLSIQAFLKSSSFAFLSTYKFLSTSRQLHHYVALEALPVDVICLYVDVYPSAVPCPTRPSPNGAGPSSGQASSRTGGSLFQSGQKRPAGDFFPWPDGEGGDTGPPRRFYGPSRWNGRRKVTLLLG